MVDLFSIQSKNISEDYFARGAYRRNFRGSTAVELPSRHNNRASRGMLWYCSFWSDVNIKPELRQQINQEPQDCDSNFEIDEFQLAKACIDFQPIVLLSKLDSVLTEA